MSEVEKQVSKRKRKAQESWASKKSDKKTKTAPGDAGTSNDDVPINPLIGEVSKPPKKKKSVATSMTDGNAVTASDADGPVGADDDEGKSHKKKRFILFLGNLSYATTVEDIQAHIAPTGVKPIGIRFQTDPVTKKPKGFAFIDLPDFMSLDRVLNLHHTTLGGRKINVELTAGGGGSGEKRKAKISKKNEKLGVERETAQKNKRDADAKKVRAGGGGGGLGDSKMASSSGQQEEMDMSYINPARRRRMTRK